ncbi:hypothetical protein AVEN_114037-1 [Araneus ventricosus]|uniref:Uncharacterized protein n=1 Tax=Araneus ventricosus TaxID=182803 RepID=A0A4Y2JDL4_ARAVE|nr:hypothetical protein AVEN_114037-1 [Araneus ventricosus]
MLSDHFTIWCHFLAPYPPDPHKLSTLLSPYGAIFSSYIYPIPMLFGHYLHHMVPFSAPYSDSYVIRHFTIWCHFLAPYPSDSMLFGHSFTIWCHFLAPISIRFPCYLIFHHGAIFYSPISTRSLCLDITSTIWCHFLASNICLILCYSTFHHMVPFSASYLSDSMLSGYFHYMVPFSAPYIHLIPICYLTFSVHHMVPFSSPISIRFICFLTFFTI